MINFNNILHDIVIMENANNALYHGSGMDFDEFDVSKSTSATEVAHHGYGIYLIDDIETAKEYVKMYSVGSKGFIYTCRLPSDLNIVHWDEMIPLETFMEMAEEIEEFDKELGEEMREYPEGYNDETFTYGELYDVMKSIKEYENPNTFFQGHYIDGFVAMNKINPDNTEYCIFDNKNIKILNKEKSI